MPLQTPAAAAADLAVAPQPAREAAAHTAAAAAAAAARPTQEAPLGQSWPLARPSPQAPGTLQQQTQTAAQQLPWLQPAPEPGEAPAPPAPKLAAAEVRLLLLLLLLQALLLSQVKAPALAAAAAAGAGARPAAAPAPLPQRLPAAARPAPQRGGASAAAAGARTPFAAAPRSPDSLQQQQRRQQSAEGGRSCGRVEWVTYDTAGPRMVRLKPPKALSPSAAANDSRVYSLTNSHRLCATSASPPASDIILQAARSMQCSDAIQCQHPSGEWRGRTQR